MVLQDNRSPLAHSRLHIPRLELDVSRIAATCGALLLNLGVLGLLLVPATMPPTAVVAPDTIWVLPAPRIKPPPLPPTVDIVRDKPVPTPVAPRAVVQPDPRPTVVDQSVVEQGTLQADPLASTSVPSTAIDGAPSSGPVAGIALRYLRADAPPYPREQLLAGVEGTVLLKVLVGVDGKPIRVDIQTSSGNRRLDDAARRFVLRNWLFEPAMQDGQAVQAVGIVPIAFNLGR